MSRKRCEPAIIASASGTDLRDIARVRGRSIRTKSTEQDPMHLETRGIRGTRDTKPPPEEVVEQLDQAAANADRNLQATGDFAANDADSVVAPRIDRNSVNESLEAESGCGAAQRRISTATAAAAAYAISCGRPSVSMRRRSSFTRDAFSARRCSQLRTISLREQFLGLDVLRAYQESNCRRPSASGTADLVAKQRARLRHVRHTGSIVAGSRFVELDRRIGTSDDVAPPSLRDR